MAALRTGLEAAKENRFKVRSYRNAARSIQGSRANISDLIQREEDLTAVPRVGASIAKIIRELVTTGKLAYLNQLKSALPPSRVALSLIRFRPQLSTRGPDTLRVWRANTASERVRTR